MALVPDQKFSTFQAGGDLVVGDIIVGLRGGLNTKFNYTGELPPTYVVPISQGGTSATTAGQARTNLGVGVSDSPEFANIQLSGGNIYDADGAISANFRYTASAVNYPVIRNNIASNPVVFEAAGADTNVGLTFLPKGTGAIGFNTQALTNPLIIYNGTSGQHQTNFLFANTANVRNVTFQDASGTLAYLTDIPAGSPSALTRTNDTNVTVTLGGSPSTALLQATSLTMGWTGTLAGTRGGTGVDNGSSTITIGGNFAMSGAYTFTGTLTNNTSVTFPTSGTLATTSQIPTGAALTKADDTNVTLTLGGSPSTALINAASITAGWTGTLAVGRGGLGISTTPSNGQIPIGNGTNYTAATITAGVGAYVTNGAGSITIGFTGAGNWVDQTSSSVTMGANTGYTTNNGASLVTYTLPASANLGDFVEINGLSAGGWKIAQAAGQQIHYGSSATTSGVGGSLASTNQYDCARLRCAVAGGTIWVVVSTQTAGLTVV